MVNTRVYPLCAGFTHGPQIRWIDSSCGRRLPRRRIAKRAASLAAQGCKGEARLMPGRKYGALVYYPAPRHSGRAATRSVHRASKSRTNGKVTGCRW